MRIVFGYRYFGTGGVEAVLATRLRGLPREGIEAEAFYLEDLGGWASVGAERPLIHLGTVEGFREVASRADLAVVIDTPELFPEPGDRVSPWVLECHTAILPNLQYLRRIHENPPRGIIVPSRSQGTSVAALLQTSLPIEVIPNPLASGFISEPGSVSPPSQRAVVLLVGRLDELKNWRLAFAAAAELKQRHPSFELWLVGRRGEVGEVVLAAAAERDLVEHLRWLPIVHPDSMPELLDLVRASGGALLSTSRSEALAMTVIEAMSRSCPVVVPASQPFTEYVVHGLNGLLYPVGSAQGAADALQRILTEHTLALQLGAAARRAVLDRFATEPALSALAVALRRFATVEPASGKTGAPASLPPGDPVSTLLELVSTREAQEREERARQYRREVELLDHVRWLRDARDAAVARLTHLENEMREAQESREAHEREERARRDRREVELLDRVRELRDARDAALQRLADFEQTLGFRLLTRFWRAARWLIPEGSLRHRLYRQIRRKAARRASPSPILPAPADTANDTASGSPRDRDGNREDEAWQELAVLDESRTDRSSPAAVFLSGTWLLESEGQRPTQLALELARRGLPVAFCYWRWGPHDWATQNRVEAGIAQLPIDLVLAQRERLVRAFSGSRQRIAIVAFPHPDFLDLITAFRAAGWLVVYDVLDDWEEFHRVGQAIWYDEPSERLLLTSADAVFVVNDVLAARVRSLGRDVVTVVGNGFRPGLEEVHTAQPLPRGEITAGYFGYLAGAWFDWVLLAAAARQRPSWLFYLIGYGGSPEEVALPENVVLLGKQPQHTLAAYAANWDVALVPFKPDRLAAGADPIKIYEYLAMGLPVVATGVYPPPGSEAFVIRTEGVDGFLAEVAHAARRQGSDEKAARQRYAAGFTWAHRVDAMLAAIDRREQ